MIVFDNKYRWRNYYRYNNEKNTPYDYAREGLIKRLVPPAYFESKNDVFKTILMIIEKPAVFLLKQIDTLNRFKDYHWWNY